jgi:branched-chain amino acid transport system ATP-binding protein
MIEISDLHTYRGLNYVLQGVNLRIEEGACTVLLGRNGMGKTTLVHTIMGMIRPRSGRIMLGDEELIGKQPFQIARSGIVLVPQGRRIFPSLTVEENLMLAVRRPAARGAGAAAREAIDRPRAGGSPALAAPWTPDRVYDLFGNLAERRRLRGGQLSGGEQQMLAIARALLANPSLLLMDEPSEGLAPVVIERIGEVVADLRRDGLSVFLVEQNYGLAIALADTVYILSNGQVVWHGTAAELEGSAQVRETYLGV